MKLKDVLKDPSLMRGKSITIKENVVKVGDHEFECSSIEVAKKLWAKLSNMKFAWGMTNRGEAQSREAMNFGQGHGTYTGWTQHN